MYGHSLSFSALPAHLLKEVDDRPDLGGRHHLRNVPANHQVQSAAVAALEEQLALVAAGGGERYVKRHHERGRMLARERIELLIDRDAPFMELSALAAWGTEFNVGAAIVTGVGVICGSSAWSSRTIPPCAAAR